MKKYFEVVNRRSDIFVCPNSCLFRFISHLGIKIRNKNILELGFGDGQDLLEMRRRGGEAYGIDIDKRNVDEINKLRDSDGFPVALKGDISVDINKFKQDFDLIFSQDALYYLETSALISCLQNVKTKLKPGGKFLFQVITGDYAIKENKEVFDPNIILKHSPNPDNPVIFRDKEFYISALKDEGFTVIGRKIVKESFYANCESIRHNLYICAAIC